MQLLDVIGQGSYGTVHCVVWRGSVVVAKVIPVSGTECETAARQMESCRYGTITVILPCFIDVCGNMTSDTE